mgnify:CR=1 FL=1
MSEAKMTGRKVNKPGCATVRNQATALFSLPMRLGQHVRFVRYEQRLVKVLFLGMLESLLVKLTLLQFYALIRRIFQLTD